MANHARGLLVGIATALLLVFVTGCDGTVYVPVAGPQGPPGPPGPPGQGALVDDGTSVEACVDCHGVNGVAPVFDITDPTDVHFVDTDPNGPLTDAGYRQLNVMINQVDVTGTSVVIDFTVLDENGAPVSDLFASDGRFTIARLSLGAGVNDPTAWQGLINRIENPGGVGDGPGTPALQGNSERFTTNGGTFLNQAGGSYRYTSAYDPSTPVGNNLAVGAGDSLRVAIQISASDIPAGNGWCDFDADLNNPNSCSGASITRDITQTATCNGCHGATSEVKLAIHGGGRTEVEYCVTCHNPGTTDANSGNSVDMSVLVHKIHAGATLANGYKIWGFGNSLHDYSTVNFTAELSDCTFCHTGGGADEINWASTPSRQACGSCHDDVDFDTGVNHGQGGVQPNNDLCINCHPDVSTNPSQLAVREVHHGEARNAEAALYAGGANGFLIEAISWDAAMGELVVDYSVTQSGAKMDLQTAPEWTAPFGASRLAVSVAWSTDDYTNEGSGSTPALPLSANALDFAGGTAMPIGGSVYRVAVPIPGGAFDTVTATLDGHPAADLDGDGIYGDSIAVLNDFASVNIENRGTTVARRDVVDVGLCNQCHDSGRQGISLHGFNRTGEVQVCVACHTADSTDINRRPADPNDALDGKREESIDFKYMIHKIHAGADLDQGVVVYGFGNTPHDFRDVDFIGNLHNCETCHMSGTYGAANAWQTLATTIDTGAAADDPSDDLNVSSVTAVCSGCHDSAAARGHMLEQGASFIALDQDIH